MASIVEILLRAKDQASAEIKKVTGSLNELQQDGGASSEELGLDFDSLVGAITTGAAIAAAAITVFKEALEFSKEGAEIVRLQDTSAMLARSMGFDMDEIVAAVSEASLNTVSDLDIISSASKAMMLGVGSSAEELASLMEVAAIRGRALGLDATEAFDQIVRGIGRLSPKILDNLGIIIDADATYAAYAETIGKTASSLTEMEKRQALVNAVIADTAPLLAESGGLTEDAASKWEQMDAAQANFWNKIKANAAELMVWWPGFWTAVYTAMTPPERMEANVIDVIGALDEALRSGIIDQKTYDAVLGDVNNALMSNGEALDFVAKKTEAARQANTELQAAQEGGIYALIDATSNFNQFKQAAEEAGIYIGILDEETYNAEKAMRSAGESVDDYGNKTIKLAKEAGKMVIPLEAVNNALMEQERLLGELEGAQLKYNIAIETFKTDIAGQLYQGLMDAGLSEEKLTESLGALDAFFGTSYTVQYKMEAELDDLLTTLINNPEAFAPAAGKFIDTFAPLQESAIKAQDEIQRIQDLIDALPATVRINFNLSTTGSLPPVLPPHYDPVGHFTEAAGGSVHAAASGLAATLPHYWVGERGPEPFFPSQDGRIVSNTQALSALRGGAEASAKEIANAVKQGVKEAMRDTGGGKTFNLTMPTSSNPADVRMAFELLEAWA